MATWNLPGPIYYRLGKDDRTTVPGLDGRFELGRLQMIREGGDLLIVAMGAIASEAVRAAQLLHDRGVSSEVAVAASLSPAPLADLADALHRFPLVLTVEAHYPAGGLGSLVAEVIAEQGISCRLVRCAAGGAPHGVSGSTDYMHRASGLSGDCLAGRVLEALGGRAS